MAEYTARDLRVARDFARKNADAWREDDVVNLATALAAERKRALRGMARWARKRGAVDGWQPMLDTAYKQGHAAGISRALDAVVREASRRARGSK